MAEVSKEDMVKEVEREIRMRRDVYQRAAGTGPITPINQRRIEVMEAVLKTLKQLPSRQGDIFNARGSR